MKRGNILIENIIFIVLNLIFIPRFGAVGAAAAALVGNILLTIFGWLVINKMVNLNRKTG